MKVRIVCYEDVHEWILGKFALKLQEHLRSLSIAADISKVPDPAADVNHHITYWGYEHKVSPIETLMITHIDTDWKLDKLKKQLLTASMGICMSTDTVRKLIASGCPAEKLCFVNPAHDGIIRPRKTVVGITSRLYDDVRKREHLLVDLFDAIAADDFKFRIMGAGWQPILEHLQARGIEADYYERFDHAIYRDLIESLDYYLYMGQDEGSMGFLDAAAAGVATIVTPQGFHLDAPEALTYSFNKLEELKCIFEKIALQKHRRTQAVSDWTWKTYTERHLMLWNSLAMNAAPPVELLPTHSGTAALQVSYHAAPETPKSLRVLMLLHGDEGVAKGGPSTRAQQTAIHLEKLGVSVVVSSDPKPDPRSFDIVHVFNVWHPDSALALLRHLKQFQTPVICSPIYLELSEMAWVFRAIPVIFNSARNDSQLFHYLQLLGNGSLEIDGERRCNDAREIFPGYIRMVSEMITHVEGVIFLSNHERDLLHKRGITPALSHLVYNAADADLFSNASPDLFTSTYGISDFVLCVGRIEQRKNQLLLLEALKDTGIKVVLIGHSTEQNYASLLARYAKNLIWIERLPHGEMLSSAFRAARVFVLPSWCEGAPLAAIEAATAGVPLVLSDRSSEREYFGNLATYCDPASTDSIRSAVIREYQGYEGQNERVRRLKELTRAAYNWERAAEDTLKAYQATLAAIGRGHHNVAKKQDFDRPAAIFDVTACENDISIGPLEVITWAPVWMTRSERLMLYTLIYSLRPERYLEIGVFKGGSTLIACAAFDALGTAGRMFCVDIECQVDQAHWDRVKHRAELIIGASPAILPDVALKAGGSFDFALIDGDHRYESALRDAEGLVNHISEGGHILFHDAYNSDVGKAIEEFLQNHTDDVIDLGYMTRETTKGTSPDGVPANWGGLRLVRKKRTTRHREMRIINGCSPSNSDKNCMSPTESGWQKLPDSKKISVLFDISVLGLSALYESARTGVFRVVENLAHGLAAAPDIELLFCSTQHLTAHAPGTTQACRAYLATHPGLAHVPFYPDELPAADIFHSPFHALPPVTNTKARFLTVYDLIPLLFPHFTHGNFTQMQQSIFSGRKPNDYFLCISQSTKDDLCRVTGIEPGRATVTPLAADPGIFYRCADAGDLAAVRAKYGIGTAPYILSLCTLEPRKNIDHVIRAFARLVRDGQLAEARLVLVGTKGWDFDKIMQEIDNNQEFISRIVLTGYVPDEDLSALYTEALLFIYMSLYEGFGLPPLEAMQCGVPVITSNTSSLPEVVGDAGIMLDPDDQDGLCNAIQELYQNRSLRKFLSLQSIKQAGTFGWDRCVRETIAAYRAALAG